MTCNGFSVGPCTRSLHLYSLRVEAGTGMVTRRFFKMAEHGSSKLLGVSLMNIIFCLQLLIQSTTIPKPFMRAKVFLSQGSV